ncbi:hypothetical protein ALI144C_45020 [Actinosynnema sp. ALI-1.44]|uniref:hypothetical protein n=1 Tax=Actinosynnema sp. ALI-1.44 TaxID=1933779 RepID=UPI00097C5D30|nr:hypothetical protein [Actinosynnema sp. ALI-1.44]ONI73115.1 hypothetical protein ALI144C_45020 [Actinosynnema sp. ALI-1.44]
MSETTLPRIAWRATEFAQMVGMSAWQVRKLCRDGEIPGAEKWGDAWVIPDAVVQAIKAGTIPAPGQKQAS